MAAETSTSSSSSSSHDYEVFLSFTGADTRANFTDHLYHALQVRASIRTFRDSEELRYGEEIGELFSAIEQSRISIPVFSENYASSKRCLKEIAKIMERKETHGQIVLPIFYKVDPSHVRNQTGSFEKAFLEHEKKQPKETVDSWRKALRDAGNLKGWDTQDPQYRSSEANLINLVVGKTLSELNKTPLDVAKHPVGIDTHVQEVLKLLDLQSKDVIFVGIHGMGGIGKTTIAKAVCNRIFHQFDGWCFLAEVRERASKWEGLVQLQNKLMYDILKGIEVRISTDAAGINVIKQRCRNKKVLIILDDVDQDKQLDALAGGHDWFGSGSRILITTRDEHILNVDHVDKNKIYKPKELDDDLSLQLFSNHAFGRDQPLQDFRELSKEVAKVASGLPLALVLLGSLLRDKRELTDWNIALERLNKIPYDGVQKILKVSYDGLEEEDKRIFLDIACFFIGMDEENVIHILEGNWPTISIKVLVLKSLVKIDHENKLTMHDLLRDMGREIVRKEDIKNPGWRSRLWLHEEALDVLKKGKGTSKVEGLLLDFGYESKDHCLRTEAFEAMSELRLLQIDHAYLDGNFDRFPIGLKWLRWRGLPLECIPTISHLEELVVLDMSESMITEDWNGWQHIQLIKTLKVLDLSLCNCLTRTANFSNNGSLERLILDNCTRLVALHESIGHLKKLVFLSLRGCISLKEFPDSICELNSVKSLIVTGTGIEELPDDFGSLRRLERLSADNCHKLVKLPLSMGRLSSIKSLTLRECKNLEKLPEALGTMKSLTELYIDGTAIEELPDAIGSLEKLETLSARYCKKLIKLPLSMGKMRLLRYFDVEGSGVVELPRDFGMLSSLVMLYMLGCKEFKGFPENFGNLARLSYLDASICNLSEDAFPTDFGRLTSLKSLHLRFNKFCSLPACIICLTQLQTLDLECCTELQSLPDLPSSLIKLNVEVCISMDRLPNLSTLKNLEDLCLNDCKKLSVIEGITHLPLLQLALQNCRTLQSLPELPSSLIKLNAKGCVSMERLPNLSNLKSLQDLCLNECEKLPKIEGITGLSLLRQLHLENCRALQSLPDLPSGLIKLDARGCVSMERLPNLSNLTSLQDLCLNVCEKLPKIEGITGLSLLRQLHLENCRALQSLPDLPSSLIKLDARGCVSLERLPNLSNLKSLQDLCLNECEKLPKIEGITGLSLLRQLHLENCRALQSLPDLPSGLIKLDARGCVSMERLPDLSNLKSLQDLCLNECKKLPKIEGITGLSLLRQLHLENCRALQSLPDLPSGLIKLDARGCVSLERLPNLSNLTSLQDLCLNECEKLPKIEGITGLSLLRQLHLENCRALQSLPDLPSGLRKLDARGCVSMESLPNLSTLKNLKDLCLNECEKLAKIEGITDLPLLQQLHLENCKALQSLPELPPSLIELNTTSCSSARFLNLIKSKNLQVLGLCNCNKLSEIPGINSISLLRELRFHNCPRLQSLPEPLTDLKDLCLEKLAKIEGISGLTVSEELDCTEYRNLESLSELLPSLPRLTVWNRLTMERLPDLSNFKKLIHLELLQCKNLSEIPSISGLSQLQILHLGDCGKIHSLTKLPSSLIILYVQRCGSMERLELSNLENLEKLNLECCDNLTEIRGFESLESLKDLRMSGCHTCTKNFQKSVAQGMLPCSFDKRVIEPGFRQHFDIADDDNINGTVLYFVIEYEIIVPESPSPIDRNVISIAAVIRRNDAKMIECFHELKVEGMMAKTNVDQFYSCCFHGLTWFGFPLKDGDQIEVTGLCFLTEEDIRTNDESNFTNMLDEASFRGVDLKMFDFVMEHEAPEDSQQLENRVVHLINPMWVDDQGSISGLEQSERVGHREHDGAGRSTCWECCNIC